MDQCTQDVQAVAVLQLFAAMPSQEFTPSMIAYSSSKSALLLQGDMAALRWFLIVFKPIRQFHSCLMMHLHAFDCPEGRPYALSGPCSVTAYQGGSFSRSSMPFASHFVRLTYARYGAIPHPRHGGGPFRPHGICRHQLSFTAQISV